MIKNTLTIIIVTYNSEAYIESCIKSIFTNLSNCLDTKILIIDNNSEDQTKTLIKKLSKNHTVKIIINAENLGFAKAVNIGIRKNPQSDYYFLLNPDTVLDKNAIINLIECSRKNNAGICGGSTINNHGIKTGSFFRKPNIQVGLFDFTNLRKLIRGDKWHKYFYYQDTDKCKDSFPVDGVTGGCMLIRKDVIKKIGLLDESYFMYLEDVDYCIRAINKKILIYHCGNSKINHVGGASSKNADRIRHGSWMISRKIFFAKNFNILVNCTIQPIFIIDDLLILIAKHFKE